MTCIDTHGQVLQGHYTNTLKKFMADVYLQSTDEIVLKKCTEETAIDICTRSDKFYFLRNNSFTISSPIPKRSKS